MRLADATPLSQHGNDESTLQMRESTETQRLTLRRATEADLECYCERIYADADVMRMLPGGQPIPLEQARARARANLIEHWETQAFGPWLVVTKQSGRTIGHCGLRYWPQSADVEVLFALEPRAWGRGYATEAASHAVAVGFEDLSLERLIAGAHAANARSIAVLSKLGMRRWEERDFHGFHVTMFELSRTQWQAREHGPSGTMPR